MTSPNASTWLLQGPRRTADVRLPRATEVEAMSIDIETCFSRYQSRTLRCDRDVAIDVTVEAARRRRSAGNAKARVSVSVNVDNAQFTDLHGRIGGSRVRVCLVHAPRELKKGWTAADLKTAVLALFQDERVALAVRDAQTLVRLVDTYEWLRVKFPAHLASLVNAYQAVEPHANWRVGIWHSQFGAGGYGAYGVRATVDRYWGFTQAWLYTNGLTPPAPFDGRAAFAALAPLASVIAEVATHQHAQEEKVRNAAELRAVLAASAAPLLSLDKAESLDDVFAI